MRYVLARIEQDTREETYRIYVTRSLQLAPRGESLVSNYTELISQEPKETKTGDEILIEVMTKAGLSFGGKT